MAGKQRTKDEKIRAVEKRDGDTKAAEERRVKVSIRDVWGIGGFLVLAFVVIIAAIACASRFGGGFWSIIGVVVASFVVLVVLAIIGRFLGVFGEGMVAKFLDAALAALSLGIGGKRREEGREGFQGEAGEKRTEVMEPVQEVGVTEEEAEEKVEKRTSSVWPKESVPFGGPKVSEPFAGREEELKELRKALRGKKTIAAVVGMAGQGKSCLAGEWFKRGARPPEGTGLFWRRVYEVGYSFDKFVNDLHLYLTGEEIDARAVPTVEGRAALAIAALKERPCWIVLDGMERWLKRWAAEPDAGIEKLTVDDRAGQDEVLDKFLKGACFWENGSRLVLTTRAVPSALDESPPVMVGREHGAEKRLADLKEPEAVQLLEELGVEGENEIKLEAVRAYGCHAYSVHVLGIVLRRLYGGDITKWREANPFEEKKKELDVGGLFARVIEHRMEDSELLEMLACSVGPGPVEMLRELLGEEDKAVRRRLAELDKWQMVEFGKKNAEEHTVVRQYIQGGMGEEKVKDVRKGIAAWWVEREVPINPTRREEIEPLLKAVEHLAGAKEPRGGAQILHGIWAVKSRYTGDDWLQNFGYLEEDIHINGVLIDSYVQLIKREGMAELRADLGQCLYARGNALQVQGKLNEAIGDYGRAIEVYEELVEKEGRVELRNELASSYNNRGGALYRKGKLDEAIGDLGRAIAIYEELVEKEGRRELRNELAGSYNNRGNALADKGKLDEAIGDYGRAVGIREELVEEGRRELRNYLARSYNNRGFALGAQGKDDEEMEDFSRAIEIYEELVEEEGRRELRRDLEMILFNRAVARGQKKEWEGAREDIEKGAGLLRELIGEGQRHVIRSFMKTAGLRCGFAEELGGVKGAAEWANDAMRWFVEEAEAGGMNEVLSKEGRGFAGTVFGKREELIKGGLDEEILGRFVEVMKEIEELAD